MQPVTKSYDRKVHTGDWFTYFDVLLMLIPSYVTVRGWKEYVNYRGQPMTCRICDGRDHIAKDCPTKKRDDDQDQPVNMDVHEQPPPNEPDPENPGEPASDEGILEKIVTLEDCQTPSSLEPEYQQEVQEPDGQSQVWADSPEEDPITDGSEKPQEDSSSEPATPRTVQKQIFGTDTKLSEDEPASVSSVWGDDVTESSPKPTDKKPVTYCPRCRVDSHSEEGCTAALFEKANKKNSPLGTVGRVKKVRVVREHLRNSRMTWDLVVMRGKCTDGLQHILQLSDRDNVYALYLLLTYGDYAQAQHCEIRMLGNQDAMDLWRHHSKRGMDIGAAEDLLCEIHSQI